MECVADQAEPVSPIRRSRVTPQARPKRHASGGTKQKFGGPGRNRTCDTRFRKPLLFDQADQPAPSLLELAVCNTVSDLNDPLKGAFSPVARPPHQS